MKPLASLLVVLSFSALASSEVKYLCKTGSVQTNFGPMKYNIQVLAHPTLGLTQLKFLEKLTDSYELPRTQTYDVNLAGTKSLIFLEKSSGGVLLSFAGKGAVRPGQAFISQIEKYVPVICEKL